MGLNGLQKSIDKYIRRDFIFKKNVYNRNKILKINCLELYLKMKDINSIETIKVLEIMSLLELITGMKMYCKVIKKKEYNKGMVILLKNVLRKDKMYLLLEYFSFILVPLLVKRFGIYHNKMNIKEINLFNIKDKKLFYKLLLQHYMNDLLHINVIIKNGVIEDIKYLIDSLKI